MGNAGEGRHVNVAGKRKWVGDLTGPDLLCLRFGVTKGEREAWANASDGDLRSARDIAAGRWSALARNDGPTAPAVVKTGGGKAILGTGELVGEEGALWQPIGGLARRLVTIFIATRGANGRS
jgi:hypothetical protein